jgi:hypothetical protein
MCKARCAHCAHCAHCLQDDQRWIIQKEYMLHGKGCDAYRRLHCGEGRGRRRWRERTSSSVKNQLSLLVDKKNMPNLTMWTVQNCRDCLEVGNMCCEDAELQGSVTGSVAKIAHCARTPRTRKDGPPRARARVQEGSASRALRIWRGNFYRQRSNYSSSSFKRHTLDCPRTLCVSHDLKLTRKILSSTNSRTNFSLSSFRRTYVGPRTRAVSQPPKLTRKK